MNNNKFLLLIVFVFLSGSCTKVNSENEIAVQITNSDSQTYTKKTSDNISSNNRNASIVKVDEKLYLGCWSSGNGNIVYIKPTNIQTRNSYKELKYKDVTDDVAVKKGVYLLEILDLDKSNELQKYVTFKILPDDEMEGKDYDSYNDFVNDNESGRHARWVKDECKIALRFMK